MMEHSTDIKADLFGWRSLPPENSYPLTPGYRGEPGGPSQAATRAITPAAKGLRAKVLAEFIGGGDLTADQVAIRLERSPLSIRPRVAELHALGLIERTDSRGRNDSGMTATRWRIVRGQP